MSLLINTDRAAFLHADYRDAFASVPEVGCVITDTPYGARTHAGHDKAVRENLNSAKGQAIYGHADRRVISYAPWTPEDVREFVAFWAPRCSGWMACMSCDGLSPVWLEAMAAAGRVTFQPVPLVILGMTVRMAGDGPSSWAVWLNVSRPARKEFIGKANAATGGGTRPGAYVGGRGRKRGKHIGGKPLWALARIVRDYARPGDLVVDPCAGFASTAVAALGLDRGLSFAGSEVDAGTAKIAASEIERQDHPECVAAALTDGECFFDDHGNTTAGSSVDTP